MLRELAAFGQHGPESVAATSALTGPGTMSQISLTTSRNCRPALATSDGLVVTPSSEAGGGEVADFGDIGGIDEELHQE